MTTTDIAALRALSKEREALKANADAVEPELLPWRASARLRDLSVDLADEMPSLIAALDEAVALLERWKQSDPGSFLVAETDALLEGVHRGTDG